MMCKRQPEQLVEMCISCFNLLGIVTAGWVSEMVCHAGDALDLDGRLPFDVAHQRLQDLQLHAIYTGDLAASPGQVIYIGAQLHRSLYLGIVKAWQQMQMHCTRCGMKTVHSDTCCMLNARCTQPMRRSSSTRQASCPGTLAELVCKVALVMSCAT